MNSCRYDPGSFQSKRDLKTENRMLSDFLSFSKWISFVILCSVLNLLIGGCSNTSSSERQQKIQQWRAQNGKIKVLSTIAMIDDLVKQVGKEHVDCHTLIMGELDPHSYQLVKGDDETLAFSDLIFYNGLGLEHGPSLKSYLEVQTKAVAVGNRVMENNPHQVITYKGQTDPHIWMDISLWAQTVPHIVEMLSKKDPTHGDTYQKNGEALMKEMAKAHEEIRDRLQSIPESKRYLVSSHDAFNYFARAYLASDQEKKERSWETRFQAPEGLAPDSQLSTLDVQNVLDHIQKYQIGTLFAESNVSKDSIRKIVDAGTHKGLNIHIAREFLYADTMGGPGTPGDAYLKMMQHNAHTIAQEWEAPHE